MLICKIYLGALASLRGIRQLKLVPVVGVVLALGGCRSIEVKPNGRAASDQFLVASCIEGALENLTIGAALKDRKIKVNVSGPGTDKDYIAEVMKSIIIRSGGTINADPKTSPTMILNLMVQSTGSDQEVAKWVLPIPIPSIQTGITLTYIQFFNVSTQVARCHLWAYATDPKENLLFRHEPIFITHHVTNREILGITMGRTSDLRELNRNPGVLSIDKPTPRPEPQAEKK